MTRRLTLLAAGVVVVCAAILSVDYAVARFREPRDDARILALQQQVRTDATLAPRLEAEHKRITDTRRARKARSNVLAVILLAAAAGFLTGAKKLWGGPPGLQAGLQTGLPARRAQRAPAGLRVWRPAPKVPQDLSVVDEIVAREGRSLEAAIPILQAIQAHFRYLPDDALHRVCELTSITPADISGTSSFYARFRRSPVGDHIVRVCHGTACHVAGARQITDELRRGLTIPEGEDTDPSRTFTLEEVACLGCCSLAPVMMVDEQTVGKLTPTGAVDALR